MGMRAGIFVPARVRARVHLRDLFAYPCRMFRVRGGPFLALSTLRYEAVAKTFIVGKMRVACSRSPHTGPPCWSKYGAAHVSHMRRCLSGGSPSVIRCLLGEDITSAHVVHTLSGASNLTRTSITDTSDPAQHPEMGAAPTPLWVVVGLAMGPAVALGLARFAYALLLPPMRAELGWSYAAAGGQNTSNAAGYLAGALVATAFARCFGDKRVFAMGMLLTALAIGASGMTASYGLQLVLRFVAGFTGALALVAGAGLTAAAAQGGGRSRAPTLLGIYFAGGGLGITASALAVPPLIALAGWRGGWLVLGGLSLGATLFAWAVLARVPETASIAGPEGRGGWSARFLAPKLIAYSLFGAGYIAYATFIIAYLKSVEQLSDPVVSAFWAVLGLASIVAAFAWGPVLGRLRGGWGASATIGTVTLGAAMPMIWGGIAGAFLSAVLFGGSFLSVVAAVTSFARRAARPDAWTSVIAALTVAFGVGQSVGPVLSGALSDGPGGVKAGLWLSVAILAVASVIAATQPEPKDRS